MTPISKDLLYNLVKGAAIGSATSLRNAQRCHLDLLISTHFNLFTNNDKTADKEMAWKWDIRLRSLYTCSVTYNKTASSVQEIVSFTSYL